MNGSCLSWYASNVRLRRAANFWLWTALLEVFSVPAAPVRKFSDPVGHVVRHALHDLCHDVGEVLLDAEFVDEQRIDEALIVVDIARYDVQHVVHAASSRIALRDFR